MIDLIQTETRKERKKRLSKLRGCTPSKLLKKAFFFLAILSFLAYFSKTSSASFSLEDLENFEAEHVSSAKGFYCYGSSKEDFLTDISSSFVYYNQQKLMKRGESPFHLLFDYLTMRWAATGIMPIFLQPFVCPTLDFIEQQLLKSKKIARISICLSVAEDGSIEADEEKSRKPYWNTVIFMLCMNGLDKGCVD